MNLERIYDELIARGRTREKQPHMHRHRIVPGYQGGQYIPENVTLLTRKEHRIVHWILWRLYGNLQDARDVQRLGGPLAPEPWNKGKSDCWSEETKALWRKQRTGKKYPNRRSPRTRPLGKPISVNGVVYPSIMEAERQTGIPHTNLQRWLANEKIRPPSLRLEKLPC